MIEYATPTIVENASFDCARAIHFVKHDDKIAIFCDGSYEFTPQVNSTVWVVDETKFGSTESAIVFQGTLQGSHHGVAIPVDDNHVLYSLASPDRIQRTDAGADYALPENFQVCIFSSLLLLAVGACVVFAHSNNFFWCLSFLTKVTDYDGNVLHSIDDTTNKDTSCAGFRKKSENLVMACCISSPMSSHSFFFNFFCADGSWSKDNEFVLACDDEHGGVLKV